MSESYWARDVFIMYEEVTISTVPASQNKSRNFLEIAQHYGSITQHVLFLGTLWWPSTPGYGLLFSMQG
jgi:hypothetical protein